MYLEHFGLAVNPFGLSPKLDFLFKSSSFEESMAHLIYGIDNSEAIVMITGPIGTGKTMSLQSFLTNLGPTFHSALVTNTQVNSLELLKLILEDLEIDLPPRCDKSDLLILFKDFLLEASLHGRRVIIVIDEAQNLPLEVLEEVRLLTNLGQGDLQPVQIILVGQTELESLVNQPKLAQLKQRIRVHYRLDPLSRKEVADYLNHRMKVAGGEEKVFKTSAVDRIFQLSKGVPRVVNSLAGSALLSAFVAGRKNVLPEDIDEPEEATLPEPVAGAAPDKQSAASREAARETGQRRGWVAAVLILIALGAAAVYFANDIQAYYASLTARDPGTPPAISPGIPPVADAQPSASELPVFPVAVSSLAQPDQNSSVVAGADSATFGQVGDEAPHDFTAEALPVETEKPVISGQAPLGEQPRPRGDFFVHLASFRKGERARAFVDSLAAMHRDAVVKSVDISGKTWYRVYLGPFLSREEARVRVEAIRRESDLKYFKIVEMPDGPGA